MYYLSLCKKIAEMKHDVTNNCVSLRNKETRYGKCETAHSGG